MNNYGDKVNNLLQNGNNKNVPRVHNYTLVRYHNSIFNNFDLGYITIYLTKFTLISTLRRLYEHVARYEPATEAL